MPTPFRVAGLGNDLSDAGVVSTYTDALKKHLLDNPKDTVFQAHRKVLAAHGALAKALRKRNPAATDTDADDDADADSAAVGNTGHPLAPRTKAERKMWERILDQAKQSAALGNSFGTQVVPLVKRLLGKA